MREILFRGKSTDTNKWIYGFYSGETCEYPWSPTIKQANIIQQRTGLWYEVNPETVGQFTGLNDCNGAKIFEGDIISYEFDTGIVRYDDTLAAFVVYNEENETDPDMFFELENVEIIGNVHDNPELLTY